MQADEIFQQELFADCARHASDTTREAEGAQVVFRLNMLIKTSPFWELARRPELSNEQTTAILGDLLFYYPPQSPELRQIVQTFIALVQRPDLTFEQAIQINNIFNRKPLRSKQYLAFQMLFTLAQRPELTIDEAEKLAQALYRHCQPGAKAVRNMPFDQFLLQSGKGNLKNITAPKLEKEQAVNMLMQMVSKEVARAYLKLCWKPSK